MKDDELVRFLQWALPRLDMRWPGYRKVRRQVGKRIARRLDELGLADEEPASAPDRRTDPRSPLAAYRERLERDPAEWRILDGLCRITISRFYRDRRVWDDLRETVLPALAERASRHLAGRRVLRIWSAGCASGEEPYTIALAWHLDVARRFPEVRLVVLATDSDRRLLRRAHRAVYPPSSVKELPESWRQAAFRPDDGAGGRLRLRPALRSGVHFVRHDLRDGVPIRASGPGCDLIVCRNLAFTYFAFDLQARIARDLAGALAAGGGLLVAQTETPPAPAAGLVADHRVRGLYRRA